MNAFKQVIGYANAHDYYEINEALGSGTSGSVHAGIHKKTGREVAVKVLKKQEMDQTDIENLHWELNTMKICQHPHLVRLLDLFENEDYVYVIMEKCSGGDLFGYLEQRNFNISENRAKEIAH